MGNTPPVAVSRSSRLSRRAIRLVTAGAGVLSQVESAAQEWRYSRSGAGDVGSTATFYGFRYGPAPPDAPEGTRFRPLRSGDDAGLAELNAAVFAREHPYPPDRLAGWPERPERPPLDPDHCWVAETAGRVAGYCLFGADSSIDTVAVHPDFHHRRIGRRLAAAAPPGAAATGWVPAEDRRLARMAFDAGAVAHRVVHVPRRYP